MKLKKIAIAVIALILMLNLTSCGLVADILMNSEEQISVENTVDIYYHELSTYDSIFATNKNENGEPDPYPRKRVSMNVTLNGKFTELDLDALEGIMGDEAIYMSLNATVMIANRNDTAQSLGIFNVVEYAEYNRLSADSHSSVLLDDVMNAAYYEYSTNLLGKDMKGISYFYEVDGNIWTLDMACDPDDYDDMRPYFLEWAHSAEFSYEFLPQ
jgi:hypothetical protein